LEFTRLVAVSLLDLGVPVIIVPPHPKFLKKCCNDGRHFRSSYEPEDAFCKAIAVEEYLTCWSLLRSESDTTLVLSYEAMIGVKSSDTSALSNDSNHLSAQCYFRMAREIGRNRMSMLAGDYVGVDIIRDDSGLGHIDDGFTDFERTIPRKQTYYSTCLNIKNLISKYLLCLKHGSK
jgi:hypothetical protein